MIYMIGPLKTYNEIGLWDLLPVGHTRVAHRQVLHAKLHHKISSV